MSSDGAARVSRHELAFGGALVLLFLVSSAASFMAPRVINTGAAVPALERAITDSGTPLPRRRVMVVVIDGLGESTARTLPQLQRFASEGAHGTVEAEVPTFSAPGYVTLLSGVTPELSGRRTNVALFPAKVDSLMSALAAQGRAARYVSDEVKWWDDLFPGAFAESAVAAEADFTSFIRAHARTSDLLVVHPCGVDRHGHTFGAASDEYVAAARRVDALLPDWLEAWGYPESPVLIVADHGHMPKGGHGGDEPAVRRTFAVAAGSGVLPGDFGRARSVDLAPTIAALLGVPSPAHAEGRTLPVVAGTPASTFAADEVRAAQLRLFREGPRAATERAWSTARALRVAAVVLFIVGVLRVVRRPRRTFLGRAALGAISAAVALAVHLAVWGPPTFSSAPLMGHVALRFVCLTVVATALLGRWRIGTMEHAFALALGAALPALAFFALEGAFAERPFCGNALLDAGGIVAYPIAAAGAATAGVLGWWRLVRARLGGGRHDLGGDGGRRG